MIRRLLAVTALLAVSVFAAVAVGAPSAQALPYPPVIRIPVLTASAYDPCAGASNIIGGHGFQPGETVRLVLVNTGEIGRAVVKADGSFEITVTVPLSARGSNQVIATGLTSGRSARLTLEIPCVDGQDGNGSNGGTGGQGGSGNGSGSGSGSGRGTDSGSGSGQDAGSGSLASTGAAVGGIALLGLVLVGAGTTTVLVGRRRRDAH